VEDAEIVELEIELLLEAILERYGYDFRHYSRASLKRRIKHFLSKSDLDKVTEIIPRLLYDRAHFESLLYTISVTVTEMFRDPFVFKSMWRKIAPHLNTYPFFKLWNAGCATGEEVYSIAILLKEEKLYDRCQIYATDFNDLALEEAKAGIYPVEKIKTYTRNYQQSGGKESFSKYYHSKYDTVIINKGLKKNITFANHNLVSDAVFGEMNLIVCRNVLIYFDKPLQERALKLFYHSLADKGYLCLGTKESLRFSDLQDRFEVIDEKAKIYRKHEV